MATSTLNTGATIPKVGLGCWLGVSGSGENTECYEMVMEGLKQGYRHLDTAAHYGNENAVGAAIRASTITPREEIFLTTKLPGEYHGNVEAGLEASLKNLGGGYVDLYLMHWPQASDPKTGKIIPYGCSPTFVETWKAMEKVYEERRGDVKAIGVSNFSKKNLEILLKEAKIVPAVNQVEAHLYHPNASLRKYCDEKGIILTAYSPLGQPGQDKILSPILEDETVVEIAKKYGQPVGTIALSWLVQSGYTVIPKSANPKRMKSNLEVITLNPTDLETLSQIHTQPGKLIKLCVGQTKSAETRMIGGWTLEEMGWEKLD